VRINIPFCAGRSWISVEKLVLSLLNALNSEHFNLFSGAHVNPAVSLGLLSLRKLKVIQCLFYIVGQIGGAYLACALVYLVYLGQFNLYDGGVRQIYGLNATADIFYTVPAKGIANWNCLIDATVGTSLLLVFIMALGNDYNHLISNAAKPFSFVLMITTFGFSMNLNCGNPINPVCEILFYFIHINILLVFSRHVISVHVYSRLVSMVQKCFE
jgi:glycerol uptake facilitator-like aquaporin